MTAADPQGRAISLAGGTIVTIIGSLAPPLSSFGAAIVMAQSLGVEGRGAVAGGTAPFLLALSLATFGIPEAVTFFAARYSHEWRRIASTGLLLTLLSGLLASILLAVLAHSTSASGIQPLILLSIIGLIPGLFVAVLRGLCFARQEWLLVAAERILGSALRFGFMLIIASLGHLTPSAATAVMTILPAVGGIIYARVYFGREQASGSVTMRRWAISSYGLKVWIGSIAGILLLRLDQLLMVPLSSNIQLALYATAVSISEVPLILNTSLREVLFATDASRNSNQRIGFAARSTLLVCGSLALLIGTTGLFWVPFVFGKDFAACVPSMWVLLIAVGLGTPGSIAGVALATRGFPHLRSMSLVVACILNAILVVTLVPHWGALGAAWATMAGNFISSNMNIYFCRTRIGIPISAFYISELSDWKSYWRIICGALTRPPQKTLA